MTLPIVMDGSIYDLSCSKQVIHSKDQKIYQTGKFWKKNCHKQIYHKSK